MIDIEFNKLHQAQSLPEIARWLDREMPNPPLPEEQRWTIGYSDDGIGRVGISFQKEEDATLFMLRWS